MSEIAAHREHQQAAPTGQPDESLREGVRRLSLEQKVRLLTGADFWSLHPEPAVGLRRTVLSDGPAGVRGEIWDERDTSTNLPCPTALAASWDVARVESLGRLLAAEARAKHVDVLLAPTVNLHRTPYGGRHFECLSEDPLLTAEIGAAYVRGVQAGGVAATVKHFVGNDSETQRFTVDARIDERALRELYLAPFEVVVREAGVWAVMAAYNSVNGSTMTESPLLREVLRREWGFDGVVMSDWYATRTTAPAARADLDLVMPGPNGPWGPRLVEAVRSGEVPEAAVDAKVLNLLRLAARVGALEGVEPVAPAPPTPSRTEVSVQVRDAAAAGMVLLRNAVPQEPGRTWPVLPLDVASLRRVAVVGPNAAVARTVGGGSATVFPPYTVSPLAGIAAALGPQVRLDHSPGVSISDRVPPAPEELLVRPDGEPGVDVYFLDADGSLLGTDHRRTGSFAWLGSFAGIPAAQVAEIEVRTLLRLPSEGPGAGGEYPPGQYRLGCSGLGDLSLSVAGSPVIDMRIDPAEEGDGPGDHIKAFQPAVTIGLRSEEEVEVSLRYRRDTGLGDFALEGAFFQLCLGRVPRSDDEEIDRAVLAVTGADAAVVVVGTTAEVESEGFDRTGLALPGRQDELVRRVAAANSRTVVVVNSGAPVLLPWRDEVAAVLVGWFGGQEFGNALADVLLGVNEPGGRLPTTWPAQEGPWQPSVVPADGVLTYEESLHVGYRAVARAGVAPAYPFGHGLGYTAWEYLSAVPEREARPRASGVPSGPVNVPAVPVGAGDGGQGGEVVVGPGEDLRVRVTVRNTGSRRGREVVQVYARREHSTVERPALWLAGFATVDAEPGEEVTADVVVRARALEHWDTGIGAWACEPGPVTLQAGSSSVELPLVARVVVAEG